MTSRSKLALALAAGLALSAAPMLASVSAEPQVKVGYGDLNLDRSEGVSALYGRLELASKRVCRAAGRSQDEMRLARECRTEAMDGAVATADNSALASLHLAKTGRGVAGSTSVAKRE
jgi:UrcA family protein